MIISVVPREALGIVWGDVAKLMNPSVETSNGKYHIDDLYHAIVGGQYVLWVVMDGDESYSSYNNKRNILSGPQSNGNGLDRRQKNERVATYGGRNFVRILKEEWLFSP